VSIESIDVGEQCAHDSRDTRTHILGRQAREMPTIHTCMLLKAAYTLLLPDLQIVGAVYDMMLDCFTFHRLKEPEKCFAACGSP